MTFIQSSSPAILYVDNEINNLNSFNAMFRKDYKISHAVSLKEALIFLKNEPFEIIIASKNLCEMSGIDFLQSTISIRPNCTRLLVSDYINLDVENRAMIFNYLVKPWDEGKIRQILQDASELFKVKEMMTSNCW